MSAVLTPVAYQVIIGGVGGFVVGYLLKKIRKLIMIVVGVLIIALLYLGTTGTITNYGDLWNSLSGVFGQAASWLVGFISLLPFIGSFIVGFLLGFKLG